MHSEEWFRHNWLIKRVVNERVRAALPMMYGKVVYDLGCGARPYEEDILEFASAYVGVEWSNTLHDGAIDILANLNERLPIASEVADVVVSFEVLEHLSEPQNMLDEAFRILRPGGKILISVPFQWWVHEAPWDYFRYTRYGLEYMFQKAGFCSVKIAETTGFWEMWFLKLNYQTLRLIRGPRLVRASIRSFLVPFWWINQKLSPHLSRLWPAPSETAGYVVTATKAQQ